MLLAMKIMYYDFFMKNIIQNLKEIRPKLGQSCRSIHILGHYYESVVNCILFTDRLFSQAHTTYSCAYFARMLAIAPVTLLDFVLIISIKAGFDVKL